MQTITAPASRTLPSSSLTPRQAPSAIRSSETRPCLIRAPPVLAYLASASAMSIALSDSGNTRPPRSVLSGTPCSSNKAMQSCGVKAEKALYRNRPPPGTWATASSAVQLLVTLQRPFPVMSSLRPTL